MFFSPSLLEACDENDVNRAKGLILVGADIQSRDEDNLDCTCLHLDCFHANTDLTEFMLRQGAFVNEVNKAGLTPLHHSARCGHKEKTLMLLEYGADFEIRDQEGHTALRVACHGGWENKSVILLLISWGANPYDTNESRMTQVLSPFDIIVAYPRTGENSNELFKNNRIYQTAYHEDDIIILKELMQYEHNWWRRKAWAFFLSSLYDTAQAQELAQRQGEALSVPKVISSRGTEEWQVLDQVLSVRGLQILIASFL